MKQKHDQEPAMPEPTKSELEILQVLWKEGPSTVRQVNEVLNANTRPVQYTTTLKLMQIMTDKGLLLRDESSMKHVYQAAFAEKKAKGFLLEKFIESMYEGSATNLMLQLLGNKKTSRKELREIRDLLNRIKE